MPPTTAGSQFSRFPNQPPALCQPHINIRLPACVLSERMATVKSSKASRTGASGKLNRWPAGREGDKLIFSTQSQEMMSVSRKLVG